MFNSLRSEQDAWANCIKIVLGLLGKKKRQNISNTVCNIYLSI